MSNGSEGAAPLRVVAVGALQNALKLLGAEFTRQGGARVECTFTSPANLKNTLAGGQFDVIVAAAPTVAELESSGALQAASRRKAARVGIGVGIREGARQPDLSTPEAFKQAINSARNVVYTDPAMPTGSGIVTMRILAAAGLVDVVKAKGIQQNLGPGRELIAKGEYELGLFNLSEVVVPGVVIAGSVPAPLQDYTFYDGAVFANAANAHVAGDFLRFVTDKSAVAIWQAGQAEAA
jgi:ABC-type molybdate transport system substrate-binding protein